MADATSAIRYPYTPDYATPPGDTLRDTLEAIGMPQSELAKRTELSVKHINQIVLGIASITPDTALAFERVLGPTAGFWMRLEANYRARVAVDREREDLDRDLGWLDHIPVKELVRRGALEPRTDRIAQLQDVLSFFGVASVGAWRDVWQAPDAAFLKSPAFRSDPYATASWLRLGERKAALIEAEPYDRAQFQAAVSRARALTTDRAETFGPELEDLCRSAGVALVFVPEVTGTRASGAARWLTPTKAMIQLSLRYKREDHLWFSFFHEAAHILFHGKRQAFVDQAGSNDSAEEREATRFAATTLIPERFEPQLTTLTTLPEIVRFSKSIGIAPAIVVGRLQHDRVIPMNFGNGLRARLEIVE